MSEVNKKEDEVHQQSLEDLVTQITADLRGRRDFQPTLMRLTISITRGVVGLPILVFFIRLMSQWSKERDAVCAATEWEINAERSADSKQGSDDK
jgi:hypothetical protein